MHGADLTEKFVKRAVSAIILSGFFFSIYASSLKEENAKITADRKMIADLEKRLSKDERGCENPDQNLDRSVLVELQIYCNARRSAFKRVKMLPELIDDHESALKNYYANCKVVDNDESYILCESLDKVVVKSAEALNDQKEELKKDLDEMKNSADMAEKLNKKKSADSKKEFEHNIQKTLKLKKETVKMMETGLIEDEIRFKKSVIKLKSAQNSNASEINEKNGELLNGVKRLLKLNRELRNVCHAMKRKIDMANNSCTIKYSQKGCSDAEKNLTKVFDEGNEKIKAYSDEKQRLSAFEQEIHKLAIHNVGKKMEDANQQISFYIGNLKLQNGQLKQRIELSGNDIEVLKNMPGKKYLETYLGYVETMKKLEMESSGFIEFLGLSTVRINEFIKNCTQNKTEYSTECRIEGDNIVKDVDDALRKISHYGAKFSRLNSDLDAFAKKVSGN